MLNSKISAFYIMTEPEKMGYPYLESITSSLSFVDEVVLIMGRDEEESENKIRSLASNLPPDKELRVVKTNSWPAKDWNYDAMRDHIQRGLDECTHDLCMKIDCDYVFRDQYADDIRRIIQNEFRDQNMHMMSFGRINVFTPEKAVYVSAVDATPCYIINKEALRNDGVTCRISNTTGSNQPLFEKKQPDGTVVPFQDLRRVRVGQVFPESKEQFIIQYHILCPLNYSYIFMDPARISQTWASWHKAVELKFGESRASPFNTSSPNASFKHFLEYHVTEKIPLFLDCDIWDRKRVKIWETNISLEEAACRGWTQVNKTPDGDEPLVHGAMRLDIRHHPSTMQKKLGDISKHAWGYDNFGHLETVERVFLQALEDELGRDGPLHGNNDPQALVEHWALLTSHMQKWIEKVSATLMPHHDDMGSSVSDIITWPSLTRRRAQRRRPQET